MPRLYDRSIFHELILPFLMATAGLVLLGLVDVLFSLLDFLVNRGVSAGVILHIFLLKIPAVMVLFFPLCTLFASMLVVFRSIRDNEAIIYWTAGITYERLLRPILFFGLVVTLLTFVMNEWVVPATNYRANSLIQKVILKEAIPVIEEHTFFRDVGNRVIYIEKLDRVMHRMQGIMIYELGGELPRVLVAKTAEWNGEQWMLRQGTIHKFSPSGELEYEAKFDAMKLNVSYQLEGAFAKVKNTREMSIRELSAEVLVVEKAGMNARALVTELAMKYSLPFMNLIFAGLGTFLMLVSVRSSRDSWGLVSAIVLTLFFTAFFFFITGFARALGIGGQLHPQVAAWLPDGVYVAIAIILWMRFRTRR